MRVLPNTHTLGSLLDVRFSSQAYPIRETMISDGVGTLIGAILGSPFGTVIYIGHPGE